MRNTAGRSEHICNKDGQISFMALVLHNVNFTLSYKHDWKGLANRETYFWAILLDQVRHLSPVLWSISYKVLNDPVHCSPLFGQNGSCQWGTWWVHACEDNPHSHLKRHKDKCINAFLRLKRTYLHLVLARKGSWASPPAGQRWGDQISPAVLLELREEHVLSGEQRWMTWQLVDVHFLFT